MIDTNSLTILTPSVVTGIPSFNGSSSANIRNTTSRSSSSPGSGIAPCVLFSKNAAPRTGLSHEGGQPHTDNKTGTAYTSPPPSGNTPGTSFSKNAVVLSASSGNRNLYTSSSPSFHGNRFAAGSSEEDKHTVTPSIPLLSTKERIHQLRTLWHPTYFDALAAARGRLLGKVSMDEDEEASKDDTGVTEDTGALFATAAGEGTNDDAADNVESENTRQVEQESPDDEEERKEYRKRLLQIQARIAARALAKQSVEGGTGEQQTESENTGQVEQESPNDEDERKEYRKRLLQIQARITARVLAEQHN